MTWRTDRHKNPTAFTTDLAKQAGLVLNVDWVVGEPFPDQPHLFTAKLLGDPVDITLRLIEMVGFFAKTGAPRWSYTGIPRWLWSCMTKEQRVDFIGFMYQHEGGLEMRKLFPNWGKP